MRILPAGDSALLAEFDTLEEAMSHYRALRVDPPEGVLDLVPAARTVLVLHDADHGRIAEWMRTVSPIPQPDTESTASVIIPVTYDGPDLDNVAGLTELSTSEVIAAHTDQVWTVAFGGFAPGFAYLVGTDPRLHVPRRSSPRTSVPAGSVGLAGEFSGIYPRSSPGGWQLIGRTETALWDLGREHPALLQPGATVRFEQT